MKSKRPKPANHITAGALRNHAWQRFVSGPDSDLVDKLYVPALSAAVRYDRCCAYFSSSVLAAAARGFAGLIDRLIALGDSAPRPAVRLVVNEELAEADVLALIEKGDISALEAALAKRLRPTRDFLVTERLGMLGWLVKERLLEVRVGVMRQGQGILHAKFGLVHDPMGNAIVFSGSGNETAQGLSSNYEEMEVSTSWGDLSRFENFQRQFTDLWADKHRHVHTVSLPSAIELKLIRFAKDPPQVEPADSVLRRKAAIAWKFIAEAPFLEASAATCEATAPIDLWPHQRTVIREASAAWPAGRMLCDEVGLGKTIEAIMILRRLMAGRGVKRALLLLPAGLMTQWQDELREKGGLLVPRLLGAEKLIWPDDTAETVSGLAAALEHDLLIMSREMARTESNAAILLAAKPWDLVLMDEAHAARRGNKEEGEFNTETLLLRLLRQLQIRRQARSFLLLSATPMQTSPWEPWDLLSVLGEGGPWLSDFSGVRAYYSVIQGLSQGKTSQEDARRAAYLITQDSNFPAPPTGFLKLTTPKESESRLRVVRSSSKDGVISWLRKSTPLAQRMHRNTRKTLRQYHNLRLLDMAPPERLVMDKAYDFRPANGPERQAYEAIADYIERRFAELEGEKPGKGFVMTVYRRRAASSPYALRKSLERRLDNLHRVMSQKTYSDRLEESEVPADMSDADVPDGVDPASIAAGLPTDRKTAEQEAVEVKSLLARLEQLGSTDTKRDRFFDLIREISGDGRPILVFSEYADTMEYLRGLLADHYRDQVASYSGGGGAFYVNNAWTTASKKDITEALRDGKIRYLICTDAASEGLNLQAASALINYDLPWNPSKVQQRIGRIDRIGQKEPQILIYNLFLKDSIDDRVYSALRERCQLFESFVGVMQPVLARARDMLNDPKSFSDAELKQLAEEAERDYLTRETYLDSDIDQTTPSPVAVSRADISSALKLLRPEYGLRVRERAKTGTWSVSGLQSKTLHFGLTDAALLQDRATLPLTATSMHVGEIARRLARPGEQYPLVVASASSGAFRRSCAYWVTDASIEPVTDYADLVRRLETWDGQLPNPEKVADAERMAQAEATKQVRAMLDSARIMEEAGLAAQRDAAAIRLARELGRLLKCMETLDADLNHIMVTQSGRTGPLPDRIRRARQLLGNDFRFSADLIWEVDTSVAKLSPPERKSRLSGSSVDAAFDDYRWGVTPASE